MSKYNFTITLHPYGDDPNLGVVAIDKDSLYGYWEHRYGHEGGGLWFEKLDDGRIELRDFDGDYDLNAKVCAALRSAGFVVDPDFYN